MENGKDLVKISDEEYFKDPRVSQSDLKFMLQSPAHFVSNKAEPKETTPEMILGSAIHASILEPEEFTKKYIFAEIDKRTKAYKEMVENNPGKIILSKEDEKTINGILDAVHTNPIVMSLLDGAMKEHALFWTDPLAKVDCKAKFDAVKNQSIIDLKTTKNAMEFQKSIGQYRYDFQGAFYCRGMHCMTGKPFEFIMVAIEKSPPYGIRVLRLDAKSLDRGDDDVSFCLENYAKCKEKNSWPGYPLKIEDVSSPRWL